MKVLQRLFVSILFLSLFPLGLAEPLNVFFGTGGRGAEGIYHATFNPENGRFSPSKLAAKIGSPGFLTLHPNGKILYSVGRWEGGTGAIGYQIIRWRAQGIHTHGLPRWWRLPHCRSSERKVPAYRPVRWRVGRPISSRFLRQTGRTRSD